MEIIAPDIKSHFFVETDAGRPLSRTVITTLDWCATMGHVVTDRNLTLTITSQLPVGSHLGSGAAASVAVERAVAQWCGVDLPPDAASALAFEIEKIHHGTPSGIDNSVIAYEQPIWYVKDFPVQPISAASQTDQLLSRLLIADVGFSTPTKYTVALVRAGYRANVARYESYFDTIGAICAEVRVALLAEKWDVLGRCMNSNHEMLQELDVSCRELDALCQTARNSGALGAKLSGGGRGGNIIVLAQDKQHAETLCAVLLNAGAEQVFRG